MTAGVLFALIAETYRPAASVWQFSLTVVVWTVGEMTQAPLVSAVVSDPAPIELRGRYLGIASMCFSSATMIGAPLGGMVLERFDGRQVWTASFALSLFGALLFPAVGKRIAVRTSTSPPSVS